MEKYHTKIQNDYGFKENEKRILFMQTIALTSVLLILILSVGSIFNDTPFINSPLWVLLMCLLLVYIGISSIVHKVSVIRLRGFAPPEGTLAVVFGLLSILLAVIVAIAYFQGVLFFGIFG
jgi:hypothetical protein